MKQSWLGLTGKAATRHPISYTSPDYHPRTMGPSKAPPATGVLITFPPYATPGFSVPSKVIKSYGTRTCFPLGCNPPVVSSSVMNSYWNAKGSFQKSHPNAPTTTVTMMFETTMFRPVPPWTGEPVSPTTLFSGNYDDSRSGTIMITPGVNRFGGTLKLLAGANQVTFKDGFYPYYSGKGGATYLVDQYGAGTLPLLTGSGKLRPTAYRYMLTFSGYNRHTTPTYGDYYVQKVMHIPSTGATTAGANIWDWTTGRVSVTQITHCYPFPCIEVVRTTASGYDNRTTMGLYGNISLVRPRLVHSYVVEHGFQSDLIRKEQTFARIDRITVHFLPEPGGMAMLAAGLMGLLGLYLYRRD